MISLHRLLEGWKFIPRAERLFQSYVSGSWKSLTLEQPELANALPSLLPLRPSGLRSWLVMRGFPNTGCLSSFALMVSSVLHRPYLMLSQAPNMLFHNEHGSLLNLGATKSQLMSWVLGPMPWTGSLIWSALCLKSSFQGLPPGARPLIRSFADALPSP
jgi:hypothetical protein